MIILFVIFVLNFTKNIKAMKKLICSLLLVGLLFGCSKSDSTGDPSTGTMKDIDGNVYHSVTIGTQVWMVENLKTTKFNDGTSIPFVSADTQWANLSSAACCWQNLVDKNLYGVLYNWEAVNTGKLCPSGWHIPSDSEWATLSTYLGGLSVAGGKLKEAGTSHWSSPNTGATNISGFTALPAGIRNPYNGQYEEIGTSCYYYSSSGYNAESDSYGWWLGSSWSNLKRGGTDHSRSGYSVRCIRD